MKVIYKALASVGMLALSTAAALGVRHLAAASKKRKEEKKTDLEKNRENNQDDSQVTDNNRADLQVVESCVEISKMSCENESDNSSDGVVNDNLSKDEEESAGSDDEGNKTSEETASDNQG